jgi:hypothetical protein
MVLPIIGGIVGRVASSGDRKRQKEMEERALQGYEDLQAPELAQMEQRTLDRSMYTGMPSNFGGRDYEDEALAGMSEFANARGLGAQGNLAMQEARLAGAAQGNRASAAIQQNAARRGLGGNAAIVGQQVAQQGANQAASLGGMQAAAAAENRRMGATQALGGMANATEGRRSAQAMERARQMDAINRFEADIGFRTDVANRGFTQQGFENERGIADRQYGARLGRAGQYGRDADSTAGMWYGIGQGLQDSAVSVGQMMMGMPPTAAMGGAGGGAKSAGSFAPQPQASATFPGPVQPQYNQRSMSANWWDQPGY